MKKVLEGCCIPRANCVVLAVDAARDNMGIGNSIESRVLDQNPSICILSCGRHIVNRVMFKTKPQAHNPSQQIETSGFK